MNSLKSKTKICVIVPFYNEERFIGNVISNTLKFVDLVIAVNDGSDDDSEALIKDFSNVVILKHKINFGKGRALRSGFEESLKRNFDIIITLDADNQHDPNMIPIFVKAVDRYDIIIGNRLGDIKSMPLMRILSNKITSALLSIKTKQKIIDSQCGFRAYKKEVIEKIKTLSDGYEAESEILILAARNGFKIGFVDIPTIYENEISKMSPVKTILGFIRILFI